MIGQTLGGRFTVVGLVGVGSMGKVYRAVQRGTERNVALKVLRPERAREAKAKARFMREARACSSLASPHTVRVFDFGESEEGELFLAMELLEGESLAQRLKRDGRLRMLAAIETTMAALKSLEEAHARGLIHRDLKPANLFYARVPTGGGGFDEILKVLDFGGAKFIAPEGRALNAMDTLEGYVVGTPRYMSPEQAEGRSLDGRSDVYSLAAVLYHMLTGRAPFTDDDPELVLAKQIRTTPELPSVACPEAQIPRELEAILMAAMEKDRERRPKDATALSQQLAGFVDAPASSRMSVGVMRASVPVMRASVPSAAKLAPSTPGAFAPGASSSGSQPARPSASSSAPTAASARSSPSDNEPSGPAPTAPRLASPRRIARWVGAGGALAVAAVVAWFASTGSVPDSLGGHPQTSGVLVASSPATGSSTRAARASPSAGTSSTIAIDVHAVPVEALPRAHYESPPPRPVSKQRHPSAPQPAPPPVAVESAAPPPPPPAASAPPAPSATASSPYHTFE